MFPLKFNILPGTYIRNLFFQSYFFFFLQQFNCLFLSFCLFLVSCGFFLFSSIVLSFCCSLVLRILQMALSMGVTNVDGTMHSSARQLQSYIHSLVVVVVIPKQMFSSLPFVSLKTQKIRSKGYTYLTNLHTPQLPKHHILLHLSRYQQNKNP